VSAFDSLRAPVRPADPDRRFVERLRADLVAALAPPVDLPERNSTVRPTSAPPEPAPAGAPLVAARSLVPYLAVRGAAEAIEWYTAVFGARELVRYVGAGGEVGHCQLRIGDVLLMLADEYPEYGAVSPQTRDGSSVRLVLEVPDVDAVWAAAVAAGAVGHRPPADQPYGDRSCVFTDPFGHWWMVQTPTGTPTGAEIEEALGGAYRVVEAGDGDSDA
jgi:uncharacterized glyoxalase superfamily protein PhnB